MGPIPALPMLGILPASVSGRARRSPLALLSSLARLPTAPSLWMPTAVASVVGLASVAV